MFVMESIDDLWNHIAYVMAYAPNFPNEDFLTADQQMSLSRSFQLLRQGVDIAFPELSFVSKRADLNLILDRSLAAYQAGNESSGIDLLNRFQDEIFQTN